MPSIGLYPTTGTNPDYAYSRHIADPKVHTTYGWTIETVPAGDGFAPIDPSQTIIDAKAAMLSLLMQSVCAIDIIGTQIFGATAESANDQMAAIRSSRDTLSGTSSGQAWLDLFRQIHSALLGRIASDDAFRSRAARLVQMAASLINDPDTAISDDHIIDDLLVIDDLAAESPGTCVPSSAPRENCCERWVVTTPEGTVASPLERSLISTGGEDLPDRLRSTDDRMYGPPT